MGTITIDKNYSNLEIYLKENCAVDCKYFILKKVEEKNEK